MPFTTTRDGQEITAFTKEELDAAAASARRAVESERDAVKAQLAAATQSTTELQTQVQTLTGAQAEQGKYLTGFKALIGKGIDPTMTDFLLQHPMLKDADFSTEDGLTAVMTKVQPFLPQTTPPVTTPPVKQTPPPNSTGIVTPPATKTGTPITPDAIDAMSEADIIANQDAILAALKIS